MHPSVFTLTGVSELAVLIGMAMASQTIFLVEHGRAAIGRHASG